MGDVDMQVACIRPRFRVAYCCVHIAILTPYEVKGCFHIQGILLGRRLCLYNGTAGGSN